MIRDGDKVTIGFTAKGWCDATVAMPLPADERPKRPVDINFGCDFGRSFAPLPDLFCVEVLDANGNVILHVGQYGNEDSDGPQSRVPLGGDGVGLVSPHYVATHTDRRLFIADAGNSRIVSVRLGYHTEEKVALKDVEDRTK